MLWGFISRVKTKLLSKPIFRTNDISIGKNVIFGRNVTFNSKRVVIGDGTVFHDNITVNSDAFEIGDYGTIYSYCFFPGPGRLQIGHNFWLGYSSIVDCQGGTEIKNNVGVGPQSQLWTHMKFGDVMVGCRFHSEKRLVIEDDAWLVGHCLTSPVNIGEKSLAMLGSLITKDMAENRVYAGVPAKDVTDKVGNQFVETSIESRKSYLQKRIEKFASIHKVNHIWQHFDVVCDEEQMNCESAKTVFDVKNRRYAKRNTRLENRLVRFLLPDAKFIPSE